MVGTLKDTRKYKWGKNETVISFQEFKEKVARAKLPLNKESYLWLLYWCGVRKSEAYERVKEDFKLSEEFLIVDFHQRKKGGAEVPPLEVPRIWPGVDKIVKQLEKARSRYKIVYRYVNKERVGERVKAAWVWPQIQSTTAYNIIREVFGPGFYPHWLRLNRITEICESERASITMIKSFTGIKSARSIDAYLGASKRMQKKAMEIIASKRNE